MLGPFRSALSRLFGRDRTDSPGPAEDRCDKGQADAPHRAAFRVPGMS